MSTTTATKPVRVQRKRTKGFKLISPNGLRIVCVSRPGIFGNPFKGTGAVDAYRRYLAGETDFKCGPSTGLQLAFVPAWHHRQDVLNLLPKLRGHNVACFCPLDKECHGDVLLELANAPEAQS